MYLSLSVIKPCDVRVVGGAGKWKLNGTKLYNQRYGTQQSGNWELPAVGTPGTIQNKDNGNDGYLYIGPYNDILESKFDTNVDGELWERSADDESGYFTLTSKSGEYLAKKPIPYRLLVQFGEYIHTKTTR